MTCGCERCLKNNRIGSQNVAVDDEGDRCRLPSSIALQMLVTIAYPCDVHFSMDLWKTQFNMFHTLPLFPRKIHNLSDTYDSNG